MFCIRVSVPLILCLALRCVPPARAGDAGVGTLPSDSVTVFLAEIEAAQPGGGCAMLWHARPNSSCDTKVRARILHVYKSIGDSVNNSIEFDCEIHQRFVTSGTTPWQLQEKPIQAGQRYLIFSPALRDLPTIFATTPGPVLVSDDDDMIGDLELILNTEPLPTVQQASAVAAAITNSARRRSLLLSGYIGRLLAEGSDTETASLAHALESGSDQAFSLWGRWELLSTLASESKSGTEGPDNLVRAWIVMTARYFLLEPNEATFLIPDLHQVILGYIPAILEHERPRSMMRKALTPSLREGFAGRVRETAADERVPLARREQLRRFLTAIGAQ